MQKQPLLILAACFILGIIFQDKMVFAESIVYWVVAICFILLISMGFHSFFMQRVKAILLGFLFFGTGIILHFYNTLASDVPLEKKKQLVTFKIVHKLNSSEKYKKYVGIAKVENKRVCSVFYLPRTHEELDFIHCYKAEGYISNLKQPQYDFQYNFSAYLKRRDIDYQVYISDKVIAVERKDITLLDHLKQFRFTVLNRIKQVEISSKTREFLKSIILAERTEMDAGTVKDFNKSGLVHFLAISGTHIAIIFGIFYFLLIYFISLRLRKYAIILSLILIWGFAVFIGLGNSVLRSCVMLSVYFIFVLLQRKPDLLHALSLSAFFILMRDTQQIFDIGFQFSFLSVLGIYWLNPPLLRFFPRQHSYLKKILFNTVTISLGAQLATLPLALYYFHQFSLVSIIANLAIIPFSELIIVLSFIMTVLIAFRIDFDLINNGYDIVIQILLKMIHWFAEVDIISFDNIAMNETEVLSISVVIFLLRPLLFKCDSKNAMRIIIAAWFFLMVRTVNTTLENQKEELLVYHFNKNIFFSVKSGSKVCFWIPDLENKTKILQYIVTPYCTSRRIDDVEFKPLSSSVQKVVFRDHIYHLK